MYCLIDRESGTKHNMSEKQIVEFLKNEIKIENADDLEIEEISEILHFQGYDLQYQ